MKQKNLSLTNLKGTKTMTIRNLRHITNSTALRLFTAGAVLTMLVLLLPTPQTQSSSALALSGNVERDTRSRTAANDGLTFTPAVHPGEPTTLDPISSSDTPEGMMAIGKEGLGTAKEATVALNDVVALTNRMSSDKAYATRLLAAIKK